MPHIRAVVDDSCAVVGLYINGTLIETGECCDVPMTRLVEILASHLGMDAKVYRLDITHEESDNIWEGRDGFPHTLKGWGEHVDPDDRIGNAAHATF